MPDASVRTQYLKRVPQHSPLSTHTELWYPDSSPSVTSVGGTQLMDGWTWAPTSDVPLLADGSMNPAYFNYTTGGSSEPVWNESWLPGASGGGPSELFPLPSWQSGVASIIGRDERGTLDLAWAGSLNGRLLT